MRPHVRTLVAALAALAAAALAGCASSSGFVVSDGGLHASVTVPISSTTANVIGAVGIIGLLAVGNNVSPAWPAPMLPDRTINEQDCTQPIANGLANLKCR
jgi:hypothetical protein